MPFERWRSLLQRHKRQATRDSLASLPNWREGFELVERDVPDGRPGSLILCDVDHLKRLNNEVGYVKGDEVLRIIHSELHDAAAPKGGVVYLAAPYFVVRLPGSGTDDAVALAEQVRKRIPAAAAAVVGKDVTVTARFAVGAWSETNTPAAMHLVGAMDGALWHAPLPRNATVVIDENGARTFVSPDSRGVS